MAAGSTAVIRLGLFSCVALASGAGELVRPAGAPTCGAFINVHNPKAAGESVNSLMRAQAAFKFCRRNQCVDLEHGGQLFSLLHHWMANGTLRRRHPYVWTEWHAGPSMPIFTHPPSIYASMIPLAAMMRDRLARGAEGAPACRVVLATMLRRPMSHLLSTYNFVRPSLPRGTTLDDFMALLKTQRRWTYLGVLQDIPSKKDAMALPRVERSSPGHEAGWVDGGGQRGGFITLEARRDLDAAAKRQTFALLDTYIDMLDVVGFVERFEPSLQLMIDAMGLRCARWRDEVHACAAGKCIGAKGRARARAEPRVDPAAMLANASFHAHFEATFPGLEGWFAKRLAGFDRQLEGQGPAFAARVRVLRARHEQQSRNAHDALLQEADVCRVSKLVRGGLSFRLGAGGVRAGRGRGAAGRSNARRRGLRRRSWRSDSGEHY